MEIFTYFFCKYPSFFCLSDSNKKSYGNSGVVYSNPLPHVLILTAIVVGIATTSLGLALIIKIREEYDTVEEDDIQKMDEEDLKTHNKKNVLELKS